MTYLPYVYDIELVKVWDVVSKDSKGVYRHRGPIHTWNWKRFVMAWHVLIGRYDCLDWEPWVGKEL